VANELYGGKLFIFKPVRHFDGRSVLPATRTTAAPQPLAGREYNQVRAVSAQFLTA